MIYAKLLRLEFIIKACLAVQSQFRTSIFRKAGPTGTDRIQLNYRVYMLTKHKDNEVFQH